jgi:hypothetical protein
MSIGENAIREVTHEVFHEFKNCETDGKNGEHHDETIFGEKSKFKEVANEGNTINNSHDANDGKNESGAEFIKWTGDPIDEDEVDCKRNKN